MAKTAERIEQLDVGKEEVESEIEAADKQMIDEHEREEEQAEEKEEEEEDGEYQDEYTGPGEQPEADKPSKDEGKVAKWMKQNVKTKKTKFLSHNVEYFTSSKAIDALLKSKFATGDAPLFTSREQIIEFLDIMLEHKFFHRAKKVPVSLEELRGSKSASKSAKEEKATKSKETKDQEAEAEQSGGGSGGGNGDENGAGGNGADKKEQKRKRKIRLDMHPEQIFVDGSEAYVWIYDPIPIHYWIYGLILLLGAIGICLFPLWPAMLRKGVYYLSVAAAGFLVFILVLTIVRLIIFTIVWALTGGKLNFWIFPNLTEDVGFFASFWPLYESKYVSDSDHSKCEKKSSKSKAQKKKEKDSDNEEEVVAEEEEEEGEGEVEVTPLEAEKIEDIKEHDADALLRRRIPPAQSEKIGDAAAKRSDDDSNSSEAAAESDAKGSHSPSESESEISGKDYEIINASEVQNVK